MAEEDPEEDHAGPTGSGPSDRLTRTVEVDEDGASVPLPREWAGATVEVVRIGPGGRERPGYGFATAASDDAFARPVEGETGVFAGPDVVEHLRRYAADSATFAVGLAEDDGGGYHATADRTALADGLLVLGGPDERASALLANLAWQAVVGGGAGAVVARSGGTATRFARALPAARADDLAVVGGADGRSVNLLDPGVPPSAGAFFDAVDAVTDALVSLLVVVSPQLRDAVREFVMAAHSTSADTSLVELRELVRYGIDGEDATVPAWAPDRSPDLLERVEAVDREAIEWFLDSLAPFLREPACSLLSDPDPDVRLVEVVRSRAPLVVQIGAERYDVETWRTVGRALTHALWGAAREFVPDHADHPLVLVADEFGPVLAAEPGLDRLFKRLHRDRVVPAFGVRDPAAIGDEPWGHVADAVGARATFATDDPETLARITALTGLGEDSVASLPRGQFWLGGATLDADRRLLGYPPHPPQRPAQDVPWLS